MKYVISVSKMYKHRGLHYHRPSTNKYWHIIYYEYDEVDERMKMYCKQVGWFTAMYYKFHKYKKVTLNCPNCYLTETHFVKKRTDKCLGQEVCSGCYESFKDIYEEYIENMS